MSDSRKRSAADSAVEEIDGWRPAPGESPAEREKRIKREKRAAMLAGGGAGGAPVANGGSYGSGGGYSAPPPPRQRQEPESYGGWQPAAGESPAEREKRLKKEKRAAQMGGVSFNLTPAPPSGSSYMPPPPATGDYSYEGEGPGDDSHLGGGVKGGIHPSRMAAAPALAKEVEPKVQKEKTVARKNYLKKKKIRAKGRQAAMPLEKPKVLKKSKEQKRKEKAGSGSDEGSDGEGAEGEEEDEEAKEAKRLLILQKKAERKAKRDEKKAEIKRLKAEGVEVPKPTPRVTISTATKKAIIPTPTTTVVHAAPAEPTVEELEAAAEKAAEEAAKLARKEAKRLKRITRRDSPPPKSESVAPAADGADDDVPTFLSTQPGGLAPSSITDTTDATMEVDETPSTSTIAPVPSTSATIAEEPAPLLRLPSATRPAPPSAKTLGALNVHESVRNKRVVDPERKIKFSDEALGVSERGRKRLETMGMEEAFAVQTEVIPILLTNNGTKPVLYSPFLQPQDVCVSAPTGSGKTISYVVPIVETLSSRIVTRLRALILLPTRDLVAQVRETFESFGKGTGLNIGTATGQHSFAHEQAALVGTLDAGTQGGSSKVDILIATPGRLMDHLRSTPGFTLQHLRFFVVDEADRLLNQSFHEWLPTILTALKPSATLFDAAALPEVADALAPAVWDSHIGKVASDADVRASSSCQKLLFSATLSRDPAKIAALHLHRPIFVSVEDELDGNYDDAGADDELKFTLPSTLKQFMIISPPSHKPLYLFHLLHTLNLTSALCFTKSVEAATKLAKLVEFFEDAMSASAPAGDEARKRVVVKTYSSDLAPSERNRILASFKKGEIDMLISSDLISRGIDLSVSHVISYDIPPSVRSYVHRVGRTARAGKEGEAWSLVEDVEVAPLKGIMGPTMWPGLTRKRVGEKEVGGFVEAYQVALEKMNKYFAVGVRN